MSILARSRGVSLLALVLLAGVLVACGSDAAAPNNDGSGAPGGGGGTSGDGGSSGQLDGGGNASDAASSTPSTPAICAKNAGAGDYCGNDKVDNGDPSTLYTCPGPSKPPTKAIPCAAGCVVAPAGMNDTCKVPTSPNGYRLPWGSTTTMQLTQDCNDSCCNDHVGNDGYAWDWADGQSFIVRAARAGTITHMKLVSTTGCASSTCSADVNMIVIDHGDGTQAIYMHLQGSSAQAGISCGAAVKQGQALAVAGTTGHSTGVHLHFQVNGVHVDAPTCECGKDGLGCAVTYNPYPDVWVSAANQTLPITFDEWPTASKCADRRITMPTSQN